MSAVHDDVSRDVEPGPRTSSVPLLQAGFTETAPPTSAPSVSGDSEPLEADSKSGKRRFWNLGKKKEDEKIRKKKEAGLAAGTTTTVASNIVVNPLSPLHSPGSAYNSPSAHPNSHPYGSPVSPGRNLNPPSPRMHSPASSQIFERNVQEDGFHTSASPAIPAHITTENHIPPVLDASSVAITDDHLNPDNVEIVMHSAHQPAAVTVTGTGSSEATGTAWQDDLVAHPDNDDAASNYGALDANDVRRLSFISFADVVHAEHVETPTSREPGHFAGGPGVPPLAGAYRSPSPVPSQSLGSSPIRSGSTSFGGQETSPNRGGRGNGSPYMGHSPPTGGELTIETMRQALRKTGSGDLSGARSQPISAVGGDDGVAEHSFK
ncbi:hypothetical protein MMC08_001568 [Hypocenomyce scalaris]|nr:hypothetical protein [Hypocenomyce scalaris]